MEPAMAQPSTPPADRVATHVILHGRVQGVFYRNWTVEQALELGLDGWVRNRNDGTVEALFAGPSAAVADMVSRCRQGPTHAVVTDVVTTPGTDPGATGFHKLPTV
ncbi:acylphosphatase [Nitrospirillum sp. BR 11828]|uniref:acylphosphatase n=1 Tax=Nitrospirillum sp. BR 11828 TaxID=3104325 RepID=UPI002ACA5866|nr:acylphosphatase [Nitrospirillum sp. BR 11828]MDZ5647650.1 acylphosphatase [Nitrospirillum sp. BR 11828]